MDTAPEALLPSIISNVFQTNISHPGIRIHDPQILAGRQDVNLRQCMRCRCSALLKVVSLLELNTRSDASH
jgi:hypothetical protein